METMPSIENAAAWFNAHTVTHHLDVVDRVAVSIINTLTAEGSTVRFYNAAGFEFMTLKSDDASKRLDSLFGEKLVGSRHSEDGRLYAILKDADGRTREEPVEYGPSDVTVSLVAPFADLMTATRPYTEDEADYLL